MHSAGEPILLSLHLIAPIFLPLDWSAIRVNSCHSRIHLFALLPSRLCFFASPRQSVSIRQIKPTIFPGNRSGVIGWRFGECFQLSTLFYAAILSPGQSHFVALKVYAYSASVFIDCLPRSRCWLQTNRAQTGEPTFHPRPAVFPTRRSTESAGSRARLAWRQVGERDSWCNEVSWYVEPDSQNSGGQSCGQAVEGNSATVPPKVGA